MYVAAVNSAIWPDDIAADTVARGFGADKEFGGSDGGSQAKGGNSGNEIDNALHFVYS